MKKIALASLLLPAARARRHWQRLRRRWANHCPTCNYDLRATPDRCPECGAVTRNPFSDSLKPNKSQKIR